MNRSYASAFAVAFALALAPAVARADALPPETSPCTTKKAGDACTFLEVSGVCTDSTCKSGGGPEADGGTRPVYESACLRCVGSDAGSPAADAGSSGSSGTSESPGTPSSSGSSGSTSTDDAATDEGGCSTSPARRAGPFALAALVPLALVALRRRRRA